MTHIIIEVLRWIFTIIGILATVVVLALKYEINQYNKEYDNNTEDYSYYIKNDSES